MPKQNWLVFQDPLYWGGIYRATPPPKGLQILCGRPGSRFSAVEFNTQDVCVWWGRFPGKTTLLCVLLRAERGPGKVNGRDEHPEGRPWAWVGLPHALPPL